MVFLIIHDLLNAKIPSIISRHQLNTNIFTSIFWFLFNLNISLLTSLGTLPQKGNTNKVVSRVDEIHLSDFSTIVLSN